MIRSGVISAAAAAAAIWTASVLVPWLVVVHVWGRMRRGTA